MRAVVSYPGNMAHAQNVALALYEIGALDAFVTSFAWNLKGTLASLLESMPFPPGGRLAKQLSRRSVSLVPFDKVRSHPTWELVRSTVSMATHHPVLTDLAWDHLSHRFDYLVARQYVPNCDAIHCFEYTALGSFQRAKQLGVPCILHLPSLDSRQFEEIQQREKSNWPELVGRYDAYFAAKFARRYVRRCEEIELADVIIANSSLTARSHIQAGANPAKVFAVPLGSPPAIDCIPDRKGVAQKPLRAIWAGSFSLGKGAHYLLEGWRRLAAGRTAQLDVYGQFGLPQRLRATSPEGISFHGSVPQSELFNAYAQADILVFPTLSDGFGMVVAESLAHGLPVITTDMAGAADIITPDNGLIVPAADPQALTDSLQWCLDNRRQLFDMRFHALASARLRQWSHFRRDLIEAINAGLLRTGHLADTNSCAFA